MTDAQQLTQCLRQQWTLQTQHCQLLEAQGRALLACDRPRFCALQEDYARLLLALEKQEAERTNLMRDAEGNPCALPALMEQFPERARLRLAALRDGLRGTLEQAQDLSRRNQRLIRNELDYMAFTLDLFVEAGRSADAAYGGLGAAGGRMLLDRRA